eukprot:CAMPEP_0185413082 /NCGR_PEP_ID=MMETSP1365-20130426/4726_1 /TAXON_ID=38817 /ORGANISM="Gephyrocapsa oceanica, Strain RCC1303" /LENGTH=47 /DNA_ID= /DNA_START= /DNA_END= /DNA_ORIENTATION=
MSTCISETTFCWCTDWALTVAHICPRRDCDAAALAPEHNNSFSTGGG